MVLTSSSTNVVRSLPLGLMIEKPLSNFIMDVVKTGQQEISESDMSFPHAEFRLKF